MKSISKLLARELHTELEHRKIEFSKKEKKADLIEVTIFNTF